MSLPIGREDLRQPDHLALRIRKLQPHACLPRDRLHHADRGEAKAARKVLHQPDDLAATHAERGLDLEAGDDGAGRRADHRHRDFELLQALLDQLARLRKLLGGNRLGIGRCWLEEFERWQFHGGGLDSLKGELGRGMAADGRPGR
jgi:hypothetical protein